MKANIGDMVEFTGYQMSGDLDRTTTYFPKRHNHLLNVYSVGIILEIVSSQIICLKPAKIYNDMYKFKTNVREKTLDFDFYVFFNTASQQEYLVSEREIRSVLIDG